jgi:GH43 family beta-xylosidase
MNNKARYLITLLAIITGISGAVWAQSVPDGMMTNKLNPYGGADPWIQFYDGYYYLATTTWRSELIMLKSLPSAGLKSLSPFKYTLKQTPRVVRNMWAPEFHLLEGPDGKHWYYYYSAGTQEPWQINIRMC